MMTFHLAQDKQRLGLIAALNAAEVIKKAITNTGQANIILATGTSQFETLRHLIDQREIDWGKVTMFHLDEYIGLPITHPASFRKYLQERFLSRIPQLAATNLINGESDPASECYRLNQIISKNTIDLALVGIGENGHLAFNDPPADFETEIPFLVVNLDAPCRKQQLGEGWFQSLDEVPTLAISMSIRQILKSRKIICSVLDARKAIAVKECLEGPISNLHPASILQNHSDCTIYLDYSAAALLSKEFLARIH